MSDLFGIQTRSGCACAAMYGAHVLGMNQDLVKKYKEAFLDGQVLLKMGFSRLNFPYFATDEDIEFVLKAVEFVAEYAWMMLPHYTFD